MHPNGPLFFNENKEPISAVARFFLPMQKASSKTSFRLSKCYLGITSLIQILTLLSFIIRFSKWNWKSNIEIISFYGDLKSTDLLLTNMSSLLTIQQDMPFLKWSINTEFSVLQPAVCEINFCGFRYQWHCISGWMEYCWMRAADWNTSRCASHKIMK